MNMRCIILAAGLGTRMRPLTETLPKPLVQVQGRALIDWALDFVEEAGIDVAIINTSYLATMVETHVARRTSPHIIISREEEPLETGGGIANALPLLGDMPFLSMNSDAICIKKLLHPVLKLQRAFNPATMDALLLVHPVEKAIGYDGAGDFDIAEEGHVIRRSGATAPYVFTGIQILSPALFEGAPEGKFSMNALYNRDLTRVHALVHDGHWLHVGDLSGLAKAEMFLTHY
jgi:N-acetyl-alpha-D-muramate 1-phosphate uridylyltransferase